MPRHAVCAAVLLLSVSSFSLADDGPRPVRAGFTTDASAEAVRETACTIQASATIDGREHPLDVRVDGARCASTDVADGAIAMNVTSEPGANDTRDVELQAAASEGVSAEAVGRVAVSVARELRARMDARRRAARVAPPVAAPVAAPVAHPGAARVAAPEEAPKSSSSRRAGIALVAVGGATLGAGAMTALGTLVAGALDSAARGMSNAVAGAFGGTPQSGSSNVSGGYVAAGVLAGTGAVFLILGAVVWSSGGREVARVSVGPTGGSFSFKF